MNLTHLTIENYRGVRHLSIPLSRFSCLIGKNNAGKSTVLQSLSLFFSGAKLSRSDFYDDSEPIRIAITFEDISDADLDRLVPEHRDRIQAIIADRKLIVVRSYGSDGKGRFRYCGLVPRDARFQDAEVSALVKGKKGAGLVSAVEAAFPELKGTLDSSVTITKAREAIQQLAASLPDSEKQQADADLPTGIDPSITSFLPEPIYIPAVKNLADDIKTTQGTPFGKILSILLEAIEPQLGDIATLFKDLSTKFNRTIGSDGAPVDERLDEVKLIETTVQNFVRESFANVVLEINIPPPELRTLLSSAQIMVDDGVNGPIDSKGDGLRRAVVFAVLRSYVALNQQGIGAGSAVSARQDRHLLLFEEPEIYLHPAAQQTLFEALKIFAMHNHVVITTHSPAFFGPNATDNFIRLSKETDSAISPKPFTVARRVDMSDVREKDRFQLVCYENNNAAFFFDAVVLVEGDSDFIVWPHIFDLIEPRWRAAKTAVHFTRINGKSSIRRYRDFFRRFGLQVAVITDLDILTRQFDQLEPDAGLTELHSRLLQQVDNVIAENEETGEPSNRELAAGHDSGDLRAAWRRVKAAQKALADGLGSLDDVSRAVDAFFAWERHCKRLEILKSPPTNTLREAKQALLDQLRGHGVFVLEKGCLEDYYPEGIDGQDKPTMAQSLCRQIVTDGDALALCTRITCGNEEVPEFLLFARGILTLLSGTP